MVFGPSFVYSICRPAGAERLGGELPAAGPARARGAPRKVSWDTLLAGFRFHLALQGGAGRHVVRPDCHVVRRRQRAAADLRATVFLVIGPWGAGLLRSAPALGALITAVRLRILPAIRCGKPAEFSSIPASPYSAWQSRFHSWALDQRGALDPVPDAAGRRRHAEHGRSADGDPDVHARRDARPCVFAGGARCSWEPRDSSAPCSWAGMMAAWLGAVSSVMCFGGAWRSS